MLNRKQRAVLRLIWRIVTNLWRTLFLGRDHILPFVNVFHLTHFCNANCRFCSQAKALKFSRDEPLTLEQIRVVLLRLFQLSPALYITGGEPLMHRHIVPVLEMAREIGFWPIVVNTNSIILNRVRGVLRFADRIVVSMHTTVTREAARIMNVSPIRIARAYLFLPQAKQEAQQHGNRVIVNCVLTADNLHSVINVLRFCFRMHMPLTVNLAITNHQPELASTTDKPRDEYKRFIDLLLAVKRKAPWLIASTAGYLRRIKTFGPFRCRPLCILTVNPDGTVQNPCSKKYPDTAATLGSLLDEDAQPILERKLDFERRFHPCGHNCCKACYVEPALGLENPLSAIREFGQ